MTTDNSRPISNAPATFVTTHWTRVLDACGGSVDAKAALSDLCAAYYAPVFAFVRRNAPDEESARDLTQEFFARLLAQESIGRPDPELGRFRSFLLGAVKHFLSDARRHARRLKRGGGQHVESIDAGTDTSPGLQLADPRGPTPDCEFDRKWAFTLLDRALSTLARERAAAGKSTEFEVLKPWLTGDSVESSHSDAAARLGSNEGAVKVAIHRLRRHFRQVIKNEIGQTVRERADVEAELHYLLDALR